MKVQVLLAGRDLPRMAQITATLAPRDFASVIAETDSALAYVRTRCSSRPDGAVLELSGIETVAQFRELVARCPSACFVFLVDQMPPSAAVAKAAGEWAAFLDKNESSLAISATLVSLLYQRSHRVKT